MNSFTCPWNHFTFPISAPHPRFQISWSSVGPQFVKKFPGFCLAIKCPLCSHVYHQSFHSLLSLHMAPTWLHRKTNATIPTLLLKSMKMCSFWERLSPLLLNLHPPVTSVMTVLILGGILWALFLTLFSPHSSAPSPPLHRSPLKTTNTIHKLMITKPTYQSWTSTEKQRCALT